MVMAQGVLQAVAGPEGWEEGGESGIDERGNGECGESESGDSDSHMR